MVASCLINKDHYHLSKRNVFIFSNLIFRTVFIKPRNIDYHYPFKTIQAIYRLPQEFVWHTPMYFILFTCVTQSQTTDCVTSFMNAPLGIIHKLCFPYKNRYFHLHYFNDCTCYYVNPNQDSSIGSISAWYRGGPGFKSRQGREFFSENK